MKKKLIEVLRSVAQSLDKADEILRADIPSHPMRDKCFSAMSRARHEVDEAREKIRNALKEPVA